MAILSGVLFGLAPAWQIARFDPYEILKSDGAIRHGGHGRQRLRAALVVGEAALAVVLLAGAGLFLRSLTRLEEVQPGLRSARRDDGRPYIAAVAQYKEPRAAACVFYRSVMERLAAMRGVATARHSACPCRSAGREAQARSRSKGRAYRTQATRARTATSSCVAPGYFEAMRNSAEKRQILLRGQDRAGTEPVCGHRRESGAAVLAGEDPLGKHMRQRHAPPGRRSLGWWGT